MWQVINVNTLGRIVVAGSYDLDDLVARELQAGDVCGGAGHQVAVEDAEDGFVGDDQEIVLLALKFEDDGFETDGKVVVRLARLV